MNFIHKYISTKQFIHNRLQINLHYFKFKPHIRHSIVLSDLINLFILQVFHFCNPDQRSPLQCSPLNIRGSMHSKEIDIENSSEKHNKEADEADLISSKEAGAD